MRHRGRLSAGCTVVLVAACTVTPIDPDAFGDAGTGPGAGGVDDDGGDDSLTTAVDDGDPSAGDTSGDGADADSSPDDDGPGDGTGDDSGDDGGPAVCGDGMKSGAEACDGTDLGGESCQGIGFSGGTLVCNAGCMGFDTRGCTECGDGVVDAPEECEGDVGDATCETLGFDGGTVACAADCSLDTAGCFACGDGVISADEACDCGAGGCTAAELGNVACEDLPAPGGGENFDGGTLSCTAACELDTAGCTYCGDGVIAGDEDCDGALPPGTDCFDAGYLGGGTVACGADCGFDTSGCSGPICGVPDAGVGGCPPGCSSCAGGTCTFDCPGNIIDGGPCNGLTLQCPPGWPCHVDCGDEGCTDVTLQCADGVCTVDCSGIGACNGMNVECGIQQCAATCDVFSEPDMECGGSCDCVAC